MYFLPSQDPFQKKLFLKFRTADFHFMDYSDQF